MVEATLRQLYYSLTKPTAYSGVDRLYKSAKKRHPNLTRKKVEKWLRAQDSYTLHKAAPKKLRAEPRVFVKRMDEQWCMDLCDMRNIAQHNNGCNYLLTCIDVLSKHAWASEVKTKRGADVAAAFEKILESTNRRPRRIQTDLGAEFYNPHFRSVVADIEAELFSTTSRHKSSVAERFNRTLKDLMYRYFSANNTYRWLDQLSGFLQVYNRRYHRSIKMSPADVTEANQQQVFRTLYGISPKMGKRLTVGQLVRISKVKRVFDKGYLPNYSEEVFEVADVVTKRAPYRFILKDMLGARLTGMFVAEELSAVDKRPDDLWKIERVIRRNGRGRYLVKWLGFPDKFNSWVDKIDVIPSGQ